jgi:2,3-bisphosphoglycerate-independent phosphoglycerate mutase
MIDEHFIGWLLSNVVNLSETVICITSDHTTSSKTGVHTAKPVPVLVCGAGVRMDTVKSFSENSCNSGPIGVIKGIDLMPLLMKYFAKGE